MPVWSTARHNQCFSPAILSTTFIEMPFVANPRKATTDLIGELLVEFAGPLPHGFMADDDVAGGEQFLHHAETKWEAEIQPHGMADNLGREPISGVAGASGRCHSTRLLTPTPRRKRVRPAKLTVPNRVWRDC